MEKLKKFISVLVIISIVLVVNVGACSRAKEYVPDYTTASKRDLMVYTLGESTARYVYAVNGERISAELEHAQGTKKGESGENIATDIATTLGKIYYRMSHAGSTLYATDEKGEVLYHTEYDPWGNPQGKTKVNINFSGIENFNNFTGYTYDETLGIYYAQARFYNPEVKRFISEDPVKDGLNWYAYVGNNPVNSVDILGLAWAPIRQFVEQITNIGVNGIKLNSNEIKLEFVDSMGGNYANTSKAWSVQYSIPTLYIGGKNISQTIMRFIFDTKNKGVNKYGKVYLNVYEKNNTKSYALKTGYFEKYICNFMFSSYGEISVNYDTLTDAIKEHYIKMNTVNKYTDPFRGYKFDKYEHDAPMPVGTPLYAIADGTVSYKLLLTPENYLVGFGIWAQLKISSDKVINYGHLSNFPGMLSHNYTYKNQSFRNNIDRVVSIKDATKAVKAGDYIGASGNTGRSTGPHAHIDVNRDYSILKTMIPQMF